jgi:transketolase
MKIDPNRLRYHILNMVNDKQSGHIGGSFSICELVAYLYSNYDLVNKNKLILSKGHAVPAIYAALYELGLITTLDRFREINSPLQGHPDKLRLPGLIHTSTGSLGQGLSIAIGHALALKLKKSDAKVFCIIGDGEMQEGQIWEALMLAPKLQLDNLICIIDYNKFQSEGPTENLHNLRQKISSFNWVVYELENGNNTDEIKEAIDITTSNLMNIEFKTNYPQCIIAHTKKGAGISFLENTNCHSTLLTEEQYKSALKELGYE